MVRLQILSPRVCAARISEPMRRISEPISPRAMVQRPRRGSLPGRSSCSFSMATWLPGAAKPRILTMVQARMGRRGAPSVQSAGVGSAAGSVGRGGAALAAAGAPRRRDASRDRKGREGRGARRGGRPRSRGGDGHHRCDRRSRLSARVQVTEGQADPRARLPALRPRPRLRPPLRRARRLRLGGPFLRPRFRDLARPPQIPRPRLATLRAEVTFSYREDREDREELLVLERRRKLRALRENFALFAVMLLAAAR